MLSMEKKSQEHEEFNALLSFFHVPNLTNVVQENATSTISDTIEAAECENTSDVHVMAHTHSSSIDQPCTIFELSGESLTEHDKFCTYLNCYTKQELRSML